MLALLLAFYASLTFPLILLSLYGHPSATKNEASTHRMSSDVRDSDDSNSTEKVTPDDDMKKRIDTDKIVGRLFSELLSICEQMRNGNSISQLFEVRKGVVWGEEWVVGGEEGVLWG